jgi:hypothetical protein
MCCQENLLAAVVFADADRLFRSALCGLHPHGDAPPGLNQRPAFFPAHSQQNLIVGSINGSKHGNALTQK